MSIANFAACLDFVLEYEGGFVNDPRDPGGATNLGITIHTLSMWKHKPASIADVRNLSRGDAASIYRTMYWTPIAGDVLPAGVDLMLMDASVNMGVGRALEFSHATAALPKAQRIEAIDKLRCGFWRHLRTFPVFGKGWLRRETACLALARKMIAAPVAVQ